MGISRYCSNNAKFLYLILLFAFSFLFIKKYTLFLDFNTVPTLSTNSEVCQYPCEIFPNTTVNRENISKVLQSTLASKSTEPYKKSSGIKSTIISPDRIEIALIFRHGSIKANLQSSFRVAMASLLQHTSAPLRLHIVTDAAGYTVATRIIGEVQAVHRLDSAMLQTVLVSTSGVQLLAEGEGASTLGMLQEFFTSHHDSYYRDPLFFFSFFLHKILPGLTRVILLDVDIRIEGDIVDLHSHFARFQPHHIIAMSHELSPAYRHVLAQYRQQHPVTTLGGASAKGGFPGYNSGVMLIDIPRLNSSAIIESYLERAVLAERCDHYSFRGTLGDQDLYTLIAFDHPHLFYTLPCTWNRQLCEWWRNRGYAPIFDDYFFCTGKVQLYHGNCKSAIPPEV